MGEPVIDRNGQCVNNISPRQSWSEHSFLTSQDKDLLDGKEWEIKTLIKAHLEGLVCDKTSSELSLWKVSDGVPSREDVFRGKIQAQFCHFPAVGPQGQDFASASSPVQWG